MAKHVSLPQKLIDRLQIIENIQKLKASGGDPENIKLYETTLAKLDRNIDKSLDAISDVFLEPGIESDE